MAEPPKQDVPPSSAPKAVAPTPARPQNPVFRAMGIPNFRWRLPSRNWMIFWTVTGSFTAAILYDKRQTKAVQKKWCDMVAHISQQPLPVNQMPRKITVFLSAAPGDGIGPSRQYFKDYIKPILVAASMDYDVIEGRKEGDVRYGTAEQIRRFRRKKGETGNSSKEEEMDTAMIIDLSRDERFITPEPGLRGDLVLGRHTWKEYIRGLHEGWLGPLNESIPEPELETTPIQPATESPTEDLAITPSAETETKPEAEKKAEEEPEKKKPSPPPAYIPVEGYSSAPISPHIPSLLDPSAPIHQQHLLGFLKTPQRIYNFLNRRKLADDLGREAAAIVLTANRPYEHTESFASTSSSTMDDGPIVDTRAPENDAVTIQTGATYEQQNALDGEEPYWHKSVRKPRKEGDDRESIWMKDVVMDPRISERMRRFVLDSDEEERANRIASGAEKGRAREVEDLTQVKITIGDVDE